MINTLTASGCACCAFPSINEAINQSINECTDIDTDGRDQSIQHAVNQTIWPEEIVQSIWADRVKFRSIMKSQSKKYQAMIPQSTPQSTDEQIDHSKLFESSPFIQYIRQCAAQSINLLDCFTFNISQLHVKLKSFGFNGPYLSLLHLSINQILHFNETLIDPLIEGSSLAERSIVQSILIDQSDDTVFFFDPDYLQYENGQLLVDRLIESFGHILPKPTNQSNNQTNNQSIEGRTVSFRNDRRLIRLLLFRMGIDRLRDSFEKH